jgi:hypothetical protein
LKISELWSHGGAEWRDKTIDQWVVAAGSGKLTDGSDTSRDLRDLLRIVDFEQLRKFATQCLESKSTAGLALQDVINAIGERLGFVVEYGLYQGTSRSVGFDGLWSADGDYIVVEVKTTDAYRIALATGRRYLDRLIEERALPRDRCSILYVVGRFDTGDFEAQIRGSQLAWTARIVSVDALCRLLAISATLGDPKDRHKIYSLLRPFEYTKVDDIINLVFTAAEAPEKITGEVDSDEAESDEPAAAPAKFHAECARRIGESLGQPLVQKSRAQYSTADGSTNVIVAVSREYGDKEDDRGYWFTFHSYYEKFLSETSAGFASFGCGSPANVLMIPRDVFLPVLPRLHKKVRAEHVYYFVRISKLGSHFVLRRGRKGTEVADLTAYRI